MLVALLLATVVFWPGPKPLATDIFRVYRCAPEGASFKGLVACQKLRDKLAKNWELVGVYPQQDGTWVVAVSRLTGAKELPEVRHER
jgi:hypothetical protein